MNEETGKILQDFAPIPIRAALDKELGAALRVLVLIAAHVGKDGTCFPSQKKIADELGVSRQAVIRHINKLEESGYIKREARTRENGSSTTCLYRILYASPCNTDVTPPVTRGLHPPSLPDVTPPVTSGSYTHNIPMNKPNEDALFSFQDEKPKPGKKRKKLVREYTDEFKEFWKAFPHGLNPDKAKAFDQWESVTGDGVKPDELMQALNIHAAQVLADNTPAKYRKRAHTWLEGRVWETLLETPESVNDTGGGKWSPF